VRRVVLQLHTTLDGLADSRQGFVPIQDRTYWKALDRALAQTAASSVDALLMGRGTYRQFAAFWPQVATDPNAPKDWKEQARRLHEIPKIVFSRSLAKADWNRSRIVRGDVGREIARLQRQPGQNLLVPGGVEFPRSLIERDLIDEYLLSVVPVIVGEGRNRLFGRLAGPRNLEHVRTWTFDNGVVLHQYRRAR